MARARERPTSPVKKGTSADVRSSVRGKAVRDGRAAANSRKAPKRAVETPRAGKRAPAKARKPARLPRSTKRSPQQDGGAAPEKPRRASVGKSPQAVSVSVLGGSGEARPSAHVGLEPEAPGHVMELHWGDDTPSSRRTQGVVQRWVKRGDALLRHLAEHGAARHEYRADLKDGRFVWVDGEGRVSAEARAQVLCSWSRATSALAMAWADPLVRATGIARVDGMPAERDDVDEESAWRIAMEAADRASAEYLYRVTTPHAWYFLALSSLTFHPQRASFSPGTPVGLVLRGLAETRRAVESRAEPAEIVRSRLSTLGQSLLLEAEYAYRSTDWVARLERTGRRLVTLGHQLPRVSFTSLAAGRSAGEWLDRQATVDLSEALALLEDEWALFA
jgi:hypothetical protein